MAYGLKIWNASGEVVCDASSHMIMLHYSDSFYLSPGSSSTRVLLH